VRFGVGAPNVDVVGVAASVGAVDVVFGAVVETVVVVVAVAVAVVVVVEEVVVVPVVHTFCGRVWVVNAGSCRPEHRQSFLRLVSAQDSISVRVSLPPHKVVLFHTLHSYV
jgi:hypothetical protein